MSLAHSRARWLMMRLLPPFSLQKEKWNILTREQYGTFKCCHKYTTKFQLFIQN
ncbi:hypothetical protein C0J52_09422 [Blattella germanica]|nr:hypothetical protein C0J52_09422 [Blattella germanica]